MKPTPRMQRLYRYLSEHRWGEPADVVVFDGSCSEKPGALEAIHIAIWDAESARDVTTFVTLGMSEQLMPQADYRVELTLGCRGPLSEEQRSQLAVFLANITEYPFMYERKLDWWERLIDPGTIPVFSDCSQVLLAPMFGVEFRYFPEPDADTKLLAVLPITPREAHILTAHGREAFLEYWEQPGVDIFSPRKDP